MKHSFLEKKPATPTAIQKLARSPKYSRKVESLMASSASAPIMSDHSLEMQGVPFMLDGLEYYYGHLKQMEKRMLLDLSSRMTGERRRSRLGFSYVHEIGSYLNVIGQFTACITSNWFSNYVNKGQLAAFCPTVLALLPFRHKNAAHRCIDKPDSRLEETNSQKESFSSLYCYVTWIGQIPQTSSPIHGISVQEQVLATDLHLTYQAKIAADHRCPILKKHNIAPVSRIESPTLDGEIFLNFKEAYAVIEAAFQFKKQP
jgi:hypothetical protein